MVTFQSKHDPDGSSDDFQVLNLAIKDHGGIEVVAHLGAQVYPNPPEPDDEVKNHRDPVNSFGKSQLSGGSYPCERVHGPIDSDVPEERVTGVDEHEETMVP